MQPLSVWEGTAEPAGFRPLSGDMEVDVAIVGAGITGVTLAMLLAQEGRRVAVLEASNIGAGTTGHSTGNLYAVVNERLHAVARKWGEEVAADVARSRGETVDFIEQVVLRLGLDCEFARRPLFLYADSPERRDDVQQEFEAASRSGLSARLTEQAPFPFASGPCLIIEDQAQFHPLRYVRGIARSVASETCRFHENTRVLEVDGSAHRLVTTGGTVTAQHIVLATHTPTGIYGVHAEMPVHREYGIGCTLVQGGYPEGIIWGAGASPPSVRSIRVGEAEYLVAVGEEYKPGQHDEQEGIRKLEQAVRTRFEVGEVAFRWSAQNYHSADMLPYVGQTLGSDAYIATGFATDGLTWGSLSARIIADAICGRTNRWANLYKASRFTPIKSARNVLQENVTVADSLTRDYVTHREKHPVDALGPGEGAIVEVDGERCAGYRDDRGMLTLLSPVCTHMGCMVHWNGFERTWDCPCHGSRFATDGRVLEGPALAPLKRKDLGA